MKLFFTVAALLFYNCVHSQTLTLDPGYASGGVVLTDLSNYGNNDIICHILKQSDGKLVAAGETTDEAVSFYKTVLIRYKTDGSIDSSFAGDGILQIEENGFVYHSAILQDDDKILLMGDKTGDAPDYISNISVRRIHTDGRTDSSFGTNGIVLLPSAITGGYGKGIAVLTDGRIIVAGKDAENSSLVVTFGLNSDGTLYPGFGTDGKRTIDLGFAENGLGCIAVQSDNRILLGGYFVGANNQSGFFCLRIQVNAGTDNSFGSNGLYKTNNSSTNYLELNSIVVTSNDKILLTGHVGNASGLSSSVKMIRLLPNGLPDNSFNGSGSADFYKTLSHDSTYVIPNAVAIHPDSSIYVAGASVNNSGGSSEFIIRIRQNGLLDSTLSTEGSGWYYNNQGGLNAVLNDIVINADSSIFVAGYKESAGTGDDMLIAAYKRLPDIAGTTYVFTGDGSWTDPLNWLNGSVPPADLPNGAMIVISPQANGTAILNVEQNILPGARIVVNNNAKLEVEGSLKIGN